MGSPGSKVGAALPFPESLCHSCAAPPRYVTSDRGSVFLYCPVFRTYPPQPVLTCAGYRPSGAAPGVPPSSGQA